MSKTGVLESDWGSLLGRPVATRVIPVENLRTGYVRFLPKLEDGSLLITVIMEKEVLQRLGKDSLLLQWDDLLSV